MLHDLSLLVSQTKHQSPLVQYLLSSAWLGPASRSTSYQYLSPFTKDSRQRDILHCIETQYGILPLVLF